MHQAANWLCARRHLGLNDTTMILKRLSILSVWCAAVTLAAPLSLRAENKIPEDCKTGGFFIGCQAYTFNHFSVFEAIEKTADAGGKVIEFYPGQKLSKEEPTVTWDHNASAETIQKVKGKLAACKVTAVNYGVVGIPKDEAEARKLFEFAKTMGLYAITTESVESLDTIEKLVKEYDIRVAFHNHPKQPKNPNYKVWDPKYVLSMVKDRDARIGSCADTGHWLRSGLKPVECLRILKGRIISSHIKDLNEMAPEAHDVPFGTGAADMPAILTELKAQHFAGNMSLEYEYHWENSTPECGQCIGFVRGYGQARKW
jgi:sugar phosphate isomerase/epimerase